MLSVHTPHTSSQKWENEKMLWTQHRVVDNKSKSAVQFTAGSYPPAKIVHFGICSKQTRPLAASYGEENEARTDRCKDQRLTRWENAQLSNTNVLLIVYRMMLLPMTFSDL